MNDSQTEINHRIKDIPCIVTLNADSVVIDLNTEKQSTSNDTRIWIEQGIDSNKNSGWKVLIQPDGADPTHCVFIDKTRNVTIFEEADPNWPSQL